MLAVPRIPGRGAPSHAARAGGVPAAAASAASSGARAATLHTLLGSLLFRAASAALVAAEPRANPSKRRGARDQGGHY